VLNLSKGRISHTIGGNRLPQVVVRQAHHERDLGSLWAVCSSHDKRTRSKQIRSSWACRRAALVIPLVEIAYLKSWFDKLTMSGMLGSPW